MSHSNPVITHFLLWDVRSGWRNIRVALIALQSHLNIDVKHLKTYTGVLIQSCIVCVHVAAQGQGETWLP